ncbi:MAG TPA: hypothetical protein VGL00_20990 [Terracidiphilus sp.]
MSRISPILLGISLSLAGGVAAAAQDATATPPKVIQLTREWLKTGKAPSAHDKSEAGFVSLSARGKLQGHYVALNSMSGKPRALYMYRYPSFEAWEKDNQTIDKNPALAADLDRLIATDGELLESLDTAVLTYNEDLSYHPRPDLSHARYYVLNVFHVRPGHHKEWIETVKMYQAACDKIGEGPHWGMYEIAFGGEAGTYIALSHRDSMKEIDQIMSGDKKFMEAMGGEEGMQKFDELFGQAVDSSRVELFSINPKQSYAEESWIKADPDFWKPKKAAPETAAVKPAAPKPAPAAAAKPGGN